MSIEYRSDRACVTPIHWHALDTKAVAAQLEARPGEGLGEDEVLARRHIHGPNRLLETPPRPRWQLFLDQFRNLLVVILIAAAILAGILGDYTDAIVILVVILINAALSFWQEHRAEATLAALKKMISPKARVRRAGRVQEIAAAELVPGDLVLLEAGDRVPADGRLLATHAVEIDEASLTGESHPVGKRADVVVEVGAPLAERVDMAYMNTALTRGRAELLVTATGMATEMGRIAGMLEAADPGPTPLQLQLDALGKRLALIAGLVIAVILLLGLLQGHPFVQIVLTSVALAVAAIPEGLPAVVTVTLAVGMHRMARHRAIVKKLAAVETLGCTTVICTDKTGTLTLNRMTARKLFYAGRHFCVSGDGYDGHGAITADDELPLPAFEPLALAAASANDSRIRAGELIGDPTEGALLALAAKCGVEQEPAVVRCPRIAEIPFDSAHKFMASFHHDGDRVRIYLKGAPDVLLAGCASCWDGVADAPLSDRMRARIERENSAMAGTAMRVLGLACKTVPAREFDPTGDLVGYLGELVFLGLVGIVDPPRPEARAAIALCAVAGIQVKMITGDHKLTATAIAHELGLEGPVMTGADIDALPERGGAERIADTTVFARVAPEHKVRIVLALRQLGEVVAMTGDGVNDAPALKSADIGVAMGITGTEVTRAAATMVLTDDNFATIVRAVREGRAIYDNIVKFVRFQLSTNIGAIQTVLAASLMGMPTPFTAIQILWINIIMDGPPAMSLGVEPERPGIMQEPPRTAAARILTGRRLGRLFGYGFNMMVGTLGLYYLAQPDGDTYAMTLAFTTFVLFQFFNVFIARVEYTSAFNRQFFHNRWLWLSLGAVLILQVLVVHWGPAQGVFRTTDLTLTDWGLAILVASSVLLLDEFRKLVARASLGYAASGAIGRNR